MYPSRELSRLAAYKVMLRRRITRHRSACAAAAAHVTQPLAWLDRLLAIWRQLSPFVQLAAVPLAFLGKRSPTRRPFGTLLRWLPLMTGAVRVIRKLRASPTRD